VAAKWLALFMERRDSIRRVVNGVENDWRLVQRIHANAGKFDA